MSKDWMNQVFNHIYKNNIWKSQESISGPGSTMANTAAIRRWLPELIRELDIKVMLDIPCGDFYWMKEISMELDSYIGADIVEDMTQANVKKYIEPGISNRQFITLDITNDALPQADLIFCRDCLVHFSDADVYKALEIIQQSKAKFLLTTCFSQRASNPPITTGQWRPLNLQAPPFNLPTPERLLSEEYTGSNGNYPDKQLGLWKIENLSGL